MGECRADAGQRHAGQLKLIVDHTSAMRNFWDLVSVELHSSSEIGRRTKKLAEKI
jgi:hypothetical protein